MGGTEAGNAIADVLFGDVNPSGKLPVTFPRSVGQVPIYYNHMNTGRPPEASNRYTSKYLDVPWTPQFPFGYGLSYTQFKITNLQLSAQRISMTGRLIASVEIENVGKRSGDEVVQLYIRDVAASMTRCRNGPNADASTRNPAAASNEVSSATVYARRTDSGASCRVNRLVVARWLSNHAPSQKIRPRTRSFRTTPRRATRAISRSRSTAAAGSR